MPFEIKKNSQEDVTLVFEGYLDSRACAIMEEKILASVRNATTVVFDLAKVSYIDSSFLRICGAVSDGIREGDFSIINASDFIKRIFSIIGVTSIFK